MFHSIVTEFEFTFDLIKKEDFAALGKNDIFTCKILIYASKKDVQYTIMSSKLVLIQVVPSIMT